LYNFLARLHKKEISQKRVSKLEKETIGSWEDLTSEKAVKFMIPTPKVPTVGYALRVPTD
jgi:hypothetical protein